MNLFSFIKQRVPILDVVSDYATLKKAGHYWKGCCPFHHERTASFTVTPHKEIFYCFGCHVGGDVISFIAKIEHCSPLEAARHLVEQHGIALPEDISWDKKTESYEAKKSYEHTCEVFSQWCQAQLEKSPLAKNYILERKITKKSSDQFSLGYCSANIKSLLTFAQNKGILAQNFIDAHILKEGKMGLYIAFDERIIFPIHSHLGSTVGFGGRVFKQGDKRAKYYNSQDHTNFNKSTLLFGFDKAKKAVAQKGVAFLVEGYTDLIMMHQYGYTNSVATLGTACTLDHLKHLARYAEKLYIMYDGDAAGQNAIMRLVELCWEVSIDLYVMALPKEDDPASYLLTHGTLDEPLSHAHDIFSFVVNHLANNFGSKSLQGKMAVTKKILELIKSLKDPLKRDLLLQQASEAFNVPIDTLKQSMRHQRPIRHTPSRSASPETAIQPSSLLKVSQIEKKLFSVILNYKGVIGKNDEELLGLLLDTPLKKIFDAWCAAKTDEGTDITVLFEQLNEHEKAFVSQCITADDQTFDGTLAPAHLTHIYKKQWKKRVHGVKLKIEEEVVHDKENKKRIYD